MILATAENAGQGGAESCKIPHARRKRVACGCSPQAFMLFMKNMHEEIN